MTSPPDTTMVEVVAMALAQHDKEDWDAKNFNETMGGNEPEEMRESYRDLARAAIAAMRTPTEAMIIGGVCAVQKADDGAGEPWDYVDSAWDGMIAAALSEE